MKKTLILALTFTVFIAIFVLITLLESLKDRGSYISTATSYSRSSSTKYNNSSTQKMLNTVKSKPALSAPDQKAKNQIIKIAQENGGIIYKDNDTVLEFVSTADSILAQINNPDIDFSKRKAVNYLKSKGFSEKGICNLPLVFYLNSKIAKEYGKEEKSFSPIPDFCN